MWFWGFVCDYQRDLRETLWFRLVQYNLSTLACYFPADSADLAEEYSKLHYFAEYFVWIIGVIGIILCKSVRYIEVYLVID
jgi:hypothetical protein